MLDVKIAMYPTHAASKPVAMIPNCAATRHGHFVLDGSGPAYMEPPSLDTWPDVQWAPDYNTSRKVDLDTLTREEVASWKPGDTLLLSGRMLTGRDAAHKRIQDMLSRGEKLPVDFANRVIYYVGPVDPVRDEVVGPAGPTTATRMDKFTEMMLERTGLLAMIGKAERGPATVESIRKHGSAYLMAVGGAAYLVSKAIRGARVVGFADLGMEAIYEFDVRDMPVTVAVDSKGTSVHDTGPAAWQARIAAGQGDEHPGHGRLTRGGRRSFHSPAPPMAQAFEVHPVNPQPRLLRQAAQILHGGGVCAVPTDSSYAFVCHLDDKAAVERLRALRGVDDRHHLTLLCRDLSEVASHARVDNRLYRLLKLATPGPFTFILEATKEVPRRVSHPSRRTIGLRVPDHRVTQALLEELGQPLLATTLIPAGEELPLNDPDEIRERYQKTLDAVVSAGPCPGQPTTVIDLSGDEPVLVRLGGGDPSLLGLGDLA